MTGFTFGQPTLASRSLGSALSRQSPNLEPDGGDTIDIPVYDDPFAHEAISVLMRQPTEQVNATALVELGVLPRPVSVTVRGKPCSRVWWDSRVTLDTRTRLLPTGTITPAQGTLPVFHLRAVTPQGALSQAQVEVNLEREGRLRPGSPGGSSEASPIMVNYEPAYLTSVMPVSGRRGGGYPVTISGFGFPTGSELESVQVEIKTIDLGQRDEVRQCDYATVVNS